MSSVAARNDELVREYREGLKELTFNSKPIINNLSIIAGENRTLARDITQAVVDRMRQARPDHVLPCFYLMDSILKNVGGPYIPMFARHIVVLFSNAFQRVPHPVRGNMIRTRKTWDRIFPPAKLQTIDANVKSITDCERQSAPVHDHIAPVVPPQDRPTMCPTPPVLVVPQDHQPHMAYDQIPTPMSHQQRLRIVYPNADQILATYPPEIASILLELHTPQQTETMMNAVRTDVDHLYRSGQPHHEELHLLGALEEHFSQLLSAQPVVTPPLPQSQPSRGFGVPHHPPAAHPMHEMPPNQGSGFHPNNVPHPSAPTDLLASLPLDQLAALQQSLGSIASAKRSAAPQPLIHMPNPSPNDHPKRKDLRDPRTLRELDPAAVQLLYEALPHQCHNCGLRFSEQSEISAHLDWHFRERRRNAERLKKPMSRSWFLPLDEWMSYSGYEVKPTSATPFFGEEDEDEAGNQAGGSGAGNNSAESESRVEADDKQPDCAGCGDAFERAYDEETEDWVYLQATRHAGDQLLYHTKCLSTAEDGAELLDALEQPLAQDQGATNSSGRVSSAATHGGSQGGELGSKRTGAADPSAAKRIRV